MPKLKTRIDMHVPSSLRRPFSWALILFVTSALFSGYTIFRLSSTEKWLRHSYEIQLNIADIERNLTKAGRARTAFLENSDPRNLTDFSEARADLQQELIELQHLVSDNPGQFATAHSLQDIVESRLSVLQRSIDLQKSGRSDSEAQAKLTSELVHWAFETAGMATTMQGAEGALVETRSSLTQTLFVVILIVLFITFCLSALLFWISDRALATQLRERHFAERNAQLLSTALMHAQDEERRKFSRELHDGLGQTLVAVKMQADALGSRSPDDPTLRQLCDGLANTLREARTLSQLLHPPLLDEIGLLSAARGFTEEFSSRTSIPVTFNHPLNFLPLPKNLELTLFRVLQEALTNVHRHSKSAKAEVELVQQKNLVSIQIKDFGAGMPPEKIASFQNNGSGVGVGLAGMRNRVREQGGTLTVTSDSSGTTVSADLPLQ